MTEIKKPENLPERCMCGSLATYSKKKWAKWATGKLNWVWVCDNDGLKGRDSCEWATNFETVSWLGVDEEKTIFWDEYLRRLKLKAFE